MTLLVKKFVLKTGESFEKKNVLDPVAEKAKV